MPFVTLQRSDFRTVCYSLALFEKKKQKKEKMGFSLFGGEFTDRVWTLHIVVGR